MGRIEFLPWISGYDMGKQELMLSFGLKCILVFWKWRRKKQALVIKVGMLSSGLKYTLQGHSIVLWKTFPVEQQTKLFLPSWLLWYKIWSMSSGVFASFDSFHLSWWSWQQCICGGISRENKLSFSGTLGRVNFSCCHCGRSDKTYVSVFSHLSCLITALLGVFASYLGVGETLKNPNVGVKSGTYRQPNL